MDLTLSPDEQAFRDEVRAWISDNHPGKEPEGLSEDDQWKFRVDWQRQLHEGGWAGVSWPKEYGGRGATLIESALFNEELAASRAPGPANVLALAMGGPTLIGHGSEEQKERFLPPILTAEEIWCQGFSEPESGSDLASLKTKAVKDGDDWVVTGQKVWTTYAHHAKWCMLVARTDSEVAKHRGLTYFLMDMEQEEVQVRPLRQITGEAEFNELFIEEARIPDENVIGGVGNGWMVAITTLMNERSGLAFGLQVRLKILLGQVIDLVKEQGLEKDPLVRQRIGQLYTESEIMRLNAWRGLTGIMKTGQPGPEGSLGKWHWSDINQALTEFTMDLRGPDAPATDSEFTFEFLRARANSIEGGTTEILKNIVAERVLGLPKLR
ncbi:MAG: acyl-CoA dehydrogenase family protein [Thermoleophilaceae bacterium]|nr:acyl-CoA dehydrogenase family protein [Thermoleophilaceae bacterium]